MVKLRMALIGLMTVRIVSSISKAVFFLNFARLSRILANEVDYLLILSHVRGTAVINMSSGYSREIDR